MISYYGRELMTLKANFHAHTAKSDGEMEPQALIDGYAAAGYDVLSLTDHRQTHDPSQYDSRGMIMISGIEIHPRHARHDRAAWHVVGINIPLDFKHVRPEDEGLSIQETIDAIHDAGGLSFIAHPYWCAFSSADILPLTGYCGIEVCNTCCAKWGRGYSMQTWDELLEEKLNVNAIAVDDTHGAWALGQSWTMLCAEERSPAAVLEALRKGSFYGSQGPVFKKLSYENRVFAADFTEAVQVQIISSCCDGRSLTFPGCDGANTPGKALEHAEFDLSHLAAGQYFRFQIMDKNGHYAWSNPIRVK